MTDRRDPEIHRLVMDHPDDAVAEIEALRAENAWLREKLTERTSEGEVLLERLADVTRERDAWRIQFNQCSERWQDGVLQLGTVRWTIHEFVTEGDGIGWLNNTDFWELWADRLHTISDARPPESVMNTARATASASAEGGGEGGK